MKSLYSLSLAGAILLSAMTSANAGAPAPAASEAQAATANAAMSEGEVKKVNKETGKLTIKHGELKNLDMPPMTMVFQVKDKAILEQVKAGDRINFVADKVDGKFTVMQLTPAGQAHP